MSRLIGFYSYKGGVGRSMALAHCAVELARRGRKVLIVDLDLEAPGQHCSSLFYSQFNLALEDGRGFLEFSRAYLRREDEGLPKLAQYLVRSTTEISTLGKPAQGQIDLLPSGNVGDGNSYREALAAFNWETALKAGEGGFGLLRHLRAECEALGFDDVLIDSRTGDSDPFYVVALELAEILVMVSGYNRQNLLGTQDRLKLLEKSVEERRPKRIVLVGSPRPPDAAWEYWASQIQPVAPDLPAFEIELPYQSRLALSEDLVNLDARIEDDYSRNIQQLVAALDKTQPRRRAAPVLSLVNPFSVIRADYAPNKDLIRFYVDPGEAVTRALSDFMPVMVYGNRGTGKTMLAKHHSFETQADRLGRPPLPDDLPQLIGLYLRFDLDLLNSFNVRDERLRPDFNQLFANFFDILVTRKALNALKTFGGIEAWCDERRLFTMLLREFGEDAPTEASLNVNAFMDYLDAHFSKVRRYLNNPADVACPVKLQGNILLKLLVENLLSTPNPSFGERWFAVMVDEVEHFEIYQQTVLNTRIKQIKHADRVTYRYFLRHEGLRTRSTGADEGQIIQESHDFRTLKIDEGIFAEHFNKHVLEVTQRQLELQPQLGSIYLGVTQHNLNQVFASMLPEDEARKIVAMRRKDELAQWVSKEHPKVASEFMAWMNREPLVLRRVVGVILLNQGKNAQDIVQGFESWDQRARDWYHNYHRAGLYWLCRIYRTEKVYAGLEQILLLSGDNVRYFLEYCRAIVDDWIASAKLSDQPLTLPIPAEAQDRAIRARAQFYIDELRGKPRHAEQMLNVVRRLGTVFSAAHASPRQSQFEVNHFSIGDYDPDRSPDLQKYLRECRMENVLLRRPGNKQKSIADARLDDWVLHPCFAPYFNISPRRKKKLDSLTSDELTVLFNGDDAAFKQLLTRMRKKFDNLNAKSADDASINHPLFDDAAE